MTVAVVVPLLVWRVWRASPRTGKVLFALILLGGTTFVIARSVSPAVKYAVGGCRGPGFRWLGISDESYEASGGVFYDVVDGHRERMGSYYKKNGQWILQTDRRDGELAEQKLRFSIFGFDTVLPPIEGDEYRPTKL